MLLELLAVLGLLWLKKYKLVLRLGPSIEFCLDLRIRYHRNCPKVHDASCDIGVFAHIVLISRDNQRAYEQQLLLECSEIKALEDESREVGFTHLLDDRLEHLRVEVGCLFFVGWLNRLLVLLGFLLLLLARIVGAEQQLLGNHRWVYILLESGW